ncbi:MAG: DUF559 domain-containing protein, partial [Bacteroidetes bacterium]|nr:DUF559 domain-containing protein [Bacteroidota bacterium]
MAQILKQHSHASLDVEGVDLYETEDESTLALTSILDKFVARGNPTLVDLDFEDRLLADPGLTKIQTEDLASATEQRLVGRKLVSSVDSHEILQSAARFLALPYSEAYARHQILHSVDAKLENISSDEEQRFYEGFGEAFSITTQSRLHRQALITDLIGQDHPDVLGSRVDFAFSAGGVRWVFEVDGEQHHGDSAQQMHDQLRDEILQEAGWTVYRVPAETVRTGLTDWFVGFA